MSTCPRAGCASSARPVRLGECGNGGHGSAAQAPPDERGGNRYAGPNVHRATLLLYRLLGGQSGGSRSALRTSVKAALFDSNGHLVLNKPRVSSSISHPTK